MENLGTIAPVVFKTVPRNASEKRLSDCFVKKIEGCVTSGNTTKGGINVAVMKRFALDFQQDRISKTVLSTTSSPVHLLMLHKFSREFQWEKDETLSKPYWNLKF